MVTNEKMEGYLIDLISSVADIKSDIKTIKDHTLIDQDKRLDVLEDRLIKLENQRANHIASKWEKIVDFIIIAIVSGVISLATSWIKG